MRLGIRSVLEAHEKNIVILETETKEEFLKLAEDWKFSVVVIEYRVFKSIAESFLVELCQQKPYIKFLVYSDSNDISFGIDALKLGATGYLTRECSVLDFQNAVVCTHENQPFLSELLRIAIEENIFMPSSISHASLSVRELQIFKMLALGIQPVGIAAQLDISIKTVSTHKAKILEKMHLPGLSALVQYAMANNLIVLSEINSDDQKYK